MLIDNWRRNRYSWEKVEVGFIISTGRTGTEFLAKFIDENIKDVMAKHEPKPDLFELGINIIRNKHSVKKSINELKRCRYAVYNELVKSGCKKYVESNNNLALVLPYISSVFPNAKYVHIIRHPKTYLRSAFSKQHGKHQYGIFSKTDPRERLAASDYSNDKYYGRWSSMNRFAKICWHWKKYNELIETSLATKSNYLRIRHEDIFTGTRTDMKGIFELFGFLDLTQDLLINRGKLEFAFSKKSNQTNQYLLPLYDDWSPVQKDIFCDIIEDKMLAYGYS